MGYAGKKAVIVRNYDDGTNSRPYGHALVVGLAKYPRKVTKRSSEKTREKRMKMKTFVKLVNYNHLMPTRYSLDVDLKASITPDVVENATKRKGASIEARKVFEEKFKESPSGSSPSSGSKDGRFFFGLGRDNSLPKKQQQKT